MEEESFLGGNGQILQTKLQKYGPVLFVIFIQMFLYIEFVFFHCLRLMDYSRSEVGTSGAQQLYVFHVFTFLVLYCFVHCCFTFPGTIPSDSGWESQEFVRAENRATEMKRSGGYRFCKWCMKYKPDRCHHCRTCRICVLRMDHHCPWVANCIGFRNYKYFFLLLVYAVVDLLIVAVCMFESVWWSTRIDVPIVTMLLMIMGEASAWFLAILGGVFLSFHVWLMTKAMTTVEFCEKSVKKVGYDTSQYSLGAYGNICSVLGPTPLLWLVPFAAIRNGDGLTFKDSSSSDHSEDGRTGAEQRDRITAERRHVQQDGAEAAAGAGAGLRG